MAFKITPPPGTPSQPSSASPEIATGPRGPGIADAGMHKRKPSSDRPPDDIEVSRRTETSRVDVGRGLQRIAGKGSGGEYVVIAPRDAALPQAKVRNLDADAAKAPAIVPATIAPAPAPAPAPELDLASLIEIDDREVEEARRLRLAGVAMVHAAHDESAQSLKTKTKTTTHDQATSDEQDAQHVAAGVANP